MKVTKFCQGTKRSDFGSKKVTKLVKRLGHAIVFSAAMVFAANPAMAADCIVHQMLKSWWMPSGLSDGQMYYFPAEDVDFYFDSEAGLFDVSYSVNGKRQRLCRGDQPCKLDIAAAKEWVQNMPNNEGVLVFATSFFDSTGEPAWQRNVMVGHSDTGYITIAHSTGTGEMALESPIDSEFSITCHTGAGS